MLGLVLVPRWMQMLVLRSMPVLKLGLRWMPVLKLRQMLVRMLMLVPMLR